jgi:hypothetical protein
MIATIRKPRHDVPQEKVTNTTYDKLFASSQIKSEPDLSTDPTTNL